MASLRTTPTIRGSGRVRKVHALPDLERLARYDDLQGQRPHERSSPPLMTWSHVHVQLPSLEADNTRDMTGIPRCKPRLQRCRTSPHPIPHAIASNRRAQYVSLTLRELPGASACSPALRPLPRLPTCRIPRLTSLAFSSGANALLLHLSGTLPVNFRGTTYRFPISIWVPHAYPREPPLIYVVPTETMMIRPGQHIDPQGLVYHPYLVGWAEFWDKSNLQDFLTILTDIFAKEPPVIARQQARPPPSQAAPTPPPVPPLPPGMGGPASRPATQDPHPSEQSRPPPPPPKALHNASPAQASHRHPGPPLPPIPGNSPAQSNRMSRYDSAPPLPPQASSAHAQDPRLARPAEHYQPRQMPPPEPTRVAQPPYYNEAQQYNPSTQQQWQMPQQHHQRQQYQQPQQPPARSQAA
ncbi:hypothetical protein FZEAL_10254, partial [Fusarium zealandicum]